MSNQFLDGECHISCNDIIACLDVGVTFLSSTFIIGFIPFQQILAKRGTDSKFEAEANHKLLVPKSKPSSIPIYQIGVRTNAKFYPASN